MNSRKKSLRIVQLFYARPHLGGSGIMSMESSKELARRGHSVHIVSYPGTYLLEDEKNLGITIHPIQDINYPCFKSEPYHATLASQIINVYKQFGDIDIIHANYAITHGEAALLAKSILKSLGCETKVIITSHGSDIHTNGHHSLLAPAISQTLKSADALTFVSKALQDEAKSLFDLPDYGSVICNFVDETKFVPVSQVKRNKLRSIFKIPTDHFVVYHASNFRPVKQTNLLLDVSKRLSDLNVQDVSFLLVGDGPEREELQKKVVSNNLVNKFHFMGRQDDVVPFINSSDVAILPSKRESFGLALLEPMACGLPVLGSDVGGIPEVIADGTCGFVFKDKNIQEIVLKILRLKRDPVMFKKFAIASRVRAVSIFSRKTIVDSYEKLYFETLNLGMSKSLKKEKIVCETF